MEHAFTNVSFRHNSAGAIQKSSQSSYCISHKYFLMDLKLSNYCLKLFKMEVSYSH